MEKQPLHLLLVDDNEDDSLLLKRLLSKLKYWDVSVDWVSSYAPALERMLLRQHDVYLLDYRLGETDGLGLLREARAQGCTAPTIILTSLGDYELDVLAMQSGAADYLEKNHLSSTLLERSIRYALQRKHAEDLLQEQERRFHLLVQNSPDWIYIMDLTQQRVTYLNRTGFLGYSQSELEGSGSLLHALHPDDKERVLAHWHEVVRNGELNGIGLIEYRLQDKQKHWQWVKSRETIFAAGADGKPTQIVVTLTVITERKEAEEVLRRSEELYRTLARNFPNGGVILYDLDLRYLLVEGSGLTQVGLLKEQMEGKTIWDVLPPEAAAAAEPRLRAALAGEFFDQEVPYGDQIFWVQYVPVKDSQGNVTAGMIMTQNITERKRMEQALKESEELYRDLFNQIEDSIFIHDQESNVLDVNQAACERLGYSRDELLRMKTIETDAPDYAAKFYQRLTYQLETGKLHEIAGVHVARDGRRIPMHINSRRITYKGQVAVMAVGRDVTELKRAEQQEIELATERARMKVLSDFIRDVSHDFRTPLTAIGTSAYLLVRTPDSEKRQSFLEKIELHIQHMTRLVDRLILMAQLDSREGFDFQEVQLATLLWEISNQYTHMAEKKGIELRLQVADPLPVLQADENELAQAIAELVDNAIAFTPTGGVVTMQAQVVENAIVITVRDTGEGISAEVLPHIFKRLYRGDDTRSMARTAVGLGLPIAETIIEGHGGKIQVESEEGVGSTFRVLLPLADRV